MLRILFLLFLLIAALWLIRRTVAAVARRSPGGPEPAVAHMIKCAHCGTYVPEHGSVTANGEKYCSAEHRDMGTEQEQK